MLTQPFDTWEYTGAKATYGVFNAAVAAVGQSSDPPYTTDLADTGHGLLTGSLLYIQGSTNYNGLRKIISLPDADSLMIAAKYVAETLTTGATWKVMYSSPHPFLFLGFEVTLSAAGANTENLTIIRYKSADSTAYENKIYTKAMNGEQFINYMFDVPRRCGGGDRIDVAWANAGSKTWGIKLFTRRIV